jgi:hypothetical protein
MPRPVLSYRRCHDQWMEPFSTRLGAIRRRLSNRKPLVDRNYQVDAEPLNGAVDPSQISNAIAFDYEVSLLKIAGESQPPPNNSPGPREARKIGCSSPDSPFRARSIA